MIRHEASLEERGKLSAKSFIDLIDHDSSTGNDLISRVSYNSSAAKRGSREYPLFFPPSYLFLSLTESRTSVSILPLFVALTRQRGSSSKRMHSIGKDARRETTGTTG
jgi:hypothetical protein